MPPTLALAELSDEDLSDLFYTGIDAALGELNHRYRAELLAFFHRRLRDWGAAEDAVQSVFLYVVRTRETGKGRFDRDRGSYRSWLYTIAWRELINRYRQADAVVRPIGGQGGGPDAPEAGTILGGAAGAEPSPEDVVAARECFDKMPERFRAVLELRGQVGLGVEEAAAALGISKGEVSKRYYAGLRWFRACMQGHDHRGGRSAGPPILETDHDC